MVWTINAVIAPLNTISLACLIAIMAAIKNVLSPSSETMITDSEAMKPWVNPTSFAVDIVVPAFGKFVILC